jgi:phosphonate transport system substrate-binding protein
MRTVYCLVASLLALYLAGCGRDAAPDYAPTFGDRPVAAADADEYTFGVFPLHNAVRLFEAYQPLVDAVNRQAEPCTVRMEAARDYPSYDAKLRRREFNFALVNPYQAVVSEAYGYRIFGKMADDRRFVGIILVRKGAGIRTPEDLRGSPISFPAPTAFAATMLNKVFLKEHGLDVETEARPQYVGSQDSAILNVFLGLTRAGGTWPPAWEAMKQQRPDVARALEVRWQTNPLTNLALVARDDVPEMRVRQMANTLSSCTGPNRVAGSSGGSASPGLSRPSPPPTTPSATS